MAVPDANEGLTWIYAIDEDGQPLPYYGDTQELGQVNQSLEINHGLVLEGM